MTQVNYTDDQLILVARLHFIDGLPQAQIGKLIHVSQSKISRMLALARERGLVRISVPDYESRSREYEKQIREELGVEAIVIRSTPGLPAQDLRQTIGYFAAPVVSGWIDSAKVVAIAGGRTMQSLVQYMKPALRTDNVCLIQAMGNIDSSPGPYDAVELGRRLANQWQGTFLTLNTPALLPDADMCSRLLKLEQICNVLTRLAQADLALVGIGTLDNSVFLERRTLTIHDVQPLRVVGAVGEILGRFYNAEGIECDTPLKDRVVSLPLSVLKNIPKVVGVVTGGDRGLAVRAAIRGGLLKSLVIDEAAASAVLERNL